MDTNVPDDIWDDDKKPTSDVTRFTVVYRYPSKSFMLPDVGWAKLSVDLLSSEVCLVDWAWFGHRAPRDRKYDSDNFDLIDVRKEVLEWLRLWEIIELRQVGPENAEWFITDHAMSRLHFVGS